MQIRCLEGRFAIKGGKLTMISESDKIKIRDLAKRYNVKKVILFGSSCDPARESNDIDLAVEGIPPSQFFKFYGDLIFSLSKPVDAAAVVADRRVDDREPF
jgi:predicted nucleotidyltransferase